MFRFRLKEIRGDMSRAELARICVDGGLNVTERTIYNWETGSHCPRFEDVVLLAEILDRPVGDFGDLKGEDVDE